MQLEVDLSVLPEQQHALLEQMVSVFMSVAAHRSWKDHFVATDP